MINDETFINFTKQSTQRGGKEEQKEDPSLTQKHKNSQGDHKVTKEQIMFQKPPPVARSISKKEKQI
jgi:hypothetical protein